MAYLSVMKNDAYIKVISNIPSVITGKKITFYGPVNL